MNNQNTTARSGVLARVAPILKQSGTGSQSACQGDLLAFNQFVLQQPDVRVWRVGVQVLFLDQKYFRETFNFSRVR